MSKLAPLDEPHAALAQTVLAIVAASDAGRKNRCRRKGTRPRKASHAAPPLQFSEWVISCYGWDGQRYFFDVKGWYADAIVARDKHLATGRYEKAWLRSKL